MHSYVHRHINYSEREINRVRFEVLCFSPKYSELDVEKLINEIISPNGLWIDDQIECLRTGYRIEDIAACCEKLEFRLNEILSYSTAYDSPEERAQNLVLLARAVLAISKDNSKVYFSKAIEAASMIGEEAVARWNAMIALVKVIAGNEGVSSKIMHQYFRCAEYVGETVAREKYWDRDEVFELGLLLNPSATVAILSRWRDRDVGYFPHQLHALVQAGLKNDIIDGYNGSM